MANLTDVQTRGQEVFRSLVQAELHPPAGFDLADQDRPFSWFHEPDAWEATALSIGLAARAFAAEDTADGLDHALDDAASAAESARPGMVRQALSMFVTHDPNGRFLIKPRTVEMAPDYFTPSPPPASQGFDLSLGGASPELDYWREDSLANEHHEHWHQVYPFTGVARTRDFEALVTDIGLDELARVLTIWDSQTDWPAALAGASLQAIATFLADFIAAGQFQVLSVDDQRLFVKANDRHGELFIYMHAQMLARYDAELASWGLDPVEPWDTAAWSQPIPSGHDPIGLGAQFTRRETDAGLPGQWIQLLEDLQSPIDGALANGQAVRNDGTTVDLDPIIVGEMIEAAAPQTTELDTGRDATYEGLHNTGHGVLAALAPAPGGVMNNPVVAIRDPIFWRWHKHIDNLAASWADAQTPNPFDDGPPVQMRNTLDGGAAAWASPDIVLVASDALPADPQAAGVETFGGANWDVDPAQATGPAATAVVTELITTEGQRPAPGGGSAMFLRHEPFSYYLRVENPGTEPVATTARIFLAPAGVIEQRRRWIEMDKFTVTVDPGRQVIFRADSESSVIKRPAEPDPGNVGSGASGEENGYCDCGWPYTLLLPRGTVDGSQYRLIAMFTDWETDRVGEPEHCGSMSFCGALDRYPDDRDMGYPFNRPFADSIESTFATLGSAAGTSLTIRHQP